MRLTRPSTVCSRSGSFRWARPSFSSRPIRYGSGSHGGGGSSPLSKKVTASSRVHRLILAKSIGTSSAIASA
eukprot:135771-Prymnesium_polylepis.1